MGNGWEKKEPQRREKQLDERKKLREGKEDRGGRQGKAVLFYN